MSRSKYVLGAFYMADLIQCGQNPVNALIDAVLTTRIIEIKIAREKNSTNSIISF